MISHMEVSELKSKLDNGEELILIDCREEMEWAEGHIEAAQFLPLSDFENQVEKLKGKEDAVIVCQCRSGQRSLSAASFLQDEGFKNLFNLNGGILAWMEEGYPVV